MRVSRPGVLYIHNRKPLRFLNVISADELVYRAILQTATPIIIKFPQLLGVAIINTKKIENCSSAVHDLDLNQKKSYDVLNTTSQNRCAPFTI